MTFDESLSWKLLDLATEFLEFIMSKNTVRHHTQICCSGFSLGPSKNHPRHRWVQISGLHVLGSLKP